MQNWAKHQRIDMKKARIVTKEYDRNRAEQLAGELGVSLPIAKLLLTRQITDAAGTDA